MSAGQKWLISEEEKSRHITQFYSLNPEGGVLSGDRCRELFVQSKLPQDDLSHIWRLSDFDGDGQLNVGEFTVAMHLIVARISGRELPKGLPSSIKPCTAKMIPGITTKDYESYVKGFRQLDAEKRGYLSANEAKPLFIKSQLLTGYLAHVWNLADFDHDGQLTIAEFAIATHLLRFVKAGNQLPSLLDVIALLPEQVRQNVDNSTANVPELETKEPSQEGKPKPLPPPQPESKSEPAAASTEAPAPAEVASDEKDQLGVPKEQSDGRGKLKSNIKRGKWMTFSSKKPGGFFGKEKEPAAIPGDASAAFGPERSVSPPSDENPFASDSFVLTDRRRSAVSVTSLESSTSVEPFEEDPFKETDPFQDPFKVTDDPFATGGGAGDDDPFSPAKSQTDPFADTFAEKAAAADPDQFASSGEKDPFAPSGGGSASEQATGSASEFDDSFVKQPSEDKDPFSPPSGGSALGDPSTKQTMDVFDDSFAAVKSTNATAEKDPFASLTATPTTTAVEDAGSNPFESDSFTASAAGEDTNKKTEQHHVRFRDSEIETTAETYSKEEYERKDETVDPQRAEVEVIREERVTPKHGLDSIERRELDRIEREIEAMRDKAHVQFSEETEVLPTYSKEEYERKDPTVDPLKAEVEIIREEHRKPTHGLDAVEKHQLQELEEEVQRKISGQGHIKFSGSQEVFSTFSSEEYERQDSMVDPTKAAREVEFETGGKKRLVPHDSVLHLHKKQQEERRREKEALQQQLVAEIDLEWAETERKAKEEEVKAKEDAKKRGRALMEEEVKRHHEEEEKRWQEKVKEKQERESRKAKEDAKALEEAERKAKGLFDEEKRRAEDEKKREETEKETKEQMKRQEEEKKREEEEAKGRREEEEEEESKRKAQVKETEEKIGGAETEAATQKLGPKGRRGLAARWEEAVAQKDEPTSRKELDREKAMERRKREEAEILKRQQEFEEEQKRAAEEMASRTKEKQKLQEQITKTQEEEQKKKQQEGERLRREKEEQEKAKLQTVPKGRKHELAKQWEEKFGAK
eukprot:m.56512 g.56512  ORF g.56512 m.56512 type:complete len:1036 (+) comp34606_c0_seq2:571-3678(+)